MIPFAISISVPAEPGSLRLVSAVARRFLVDAAGLFPGDPRHAQILLAIREASSNVVRHAYAGRRAGSLGVRLSLLEDGIGIEIIDEGAPLEAGRLDAASLPETEDMERLAEGGYGLFLIRETMDEVGYQTGSDGKNVLHLYKRLQRAA